MPDLPTAIPLTLFCRPTYFDFYYSGDPFLHVHLMDLALVKLLLPISRMKCLTR
ncbi:unnamed protein product, partial [Rotaria magnacalcarata]